MGICELYGLICAALHGSGSTGLCGLGSEDQKKVTPEMGEEWRFFYALKLLRAAMFALEVSASREDGWGKGSLPLCKAQQHI